MSTLKVDNLLHTAGNESPISVPGAAKAWVNFNGTGTVSIRASYNVSSITDNGSGDYTVYFTNNMSDANFIGSVQVVRLNDRNTTGNMGYQSTYGGNKGVNFIRVTSIEISGINLVDADMVDVAVIGS